MKNEMNATNPVTEIVEAAKAVVTEAPAPAPAPAQDEKKSVQDEKKPAEEKKSASDLREEVKSCLCKLEQTVSDYKAVVNDKDAAIIKERLADVKAAEAQYNAAYVKAEYQAMYEAENPMKAAVEYGKMKAKKVKEKVDSKTGLVSVTIEDSFVDKRNVMSLIDFEAAAPRRMFNNGQWIYACTELAKVFAMESTDGFEMNREQLDAFNAAYAEAKADGQLVMKSYEKMKKKAAISNNDLVADLQTIFDAILFIPTVTKAGNTVNAIKATTREVKHIRNLKSSKGNDVLDVRLMSGKDLTKIVMNMMWGLATGSSYTFSVSK